MTESLDACMALKTRKGEGGSGAGILSSLFCIGKIVLKSILFSSLKINIQVVLFLYNSNQINRTKCTRIKIKRKWREASDLLR